MARSQSTLVFRPLAKVFDRSFIEDQARRLGVARRLRKVDIYSFVVVLVLGFQQGSERTLTGLRDAYARLAGIRLVPSGFYRRSTPELVRLLRGLAEAGMEQLSGTAGVPAGFLEGFRDLVVVDSTILRLHRLLSGAYASTVGAGRRGGTKLHMVMSVLDASPRKVRLTSERTHDSRPWRTMGPWVRGHLLLFDLGFFSYRLFDRIERNEGFFVTRLKSDANPLIVDNDRTCRGRALPVVGLRMQDVLGRITRKVLDVQVRIDFRRRSYDGRTSRAQRVFRVVAIRDDDTGRYHAYLTNVSSFELSAEEIARTYTLPWQVELLFRCMKQHGRLDHLPSSNQHVVEALVWSSVLALVASSALLQAVRRAVPNDRHVPLLRWASLFGRVTRELVDLLIAPTRIPARRLLLHLLLEAPDPNRDRKDAATVGLLAFPVLK